MALRYVARSRITRESNSLFRQTSTHPITGQYEGDSFAKCGFPYKRTIMWKTCSCYGVILSKSKFKKKPRWMSIIRKELFPFTCDKCQWLKSTTVCGFDTSHICVYVICFCNFDRISGTSICFKSPWTCLYFKLLPAMSKVDYYDANCKTVILALSSNAIDFSHSTRVFAINCTLQYSVACINLYVRWTTGPATKIFTCMYIFQYAIGRCLGMQYALRMSEMWLLIHALDACCWQSCR